MQVTTTDIFARTDTLTGSLPFLDAPVHRVIHSQEFSADEAAKGHSLPHQQTFTRGSVHLKETSPLPLRQRETASKTRVPLAGGSTIQSSDPDTVLNELVARANQAIAVLTSIERLVTLNPRQRRAVSQAVVEINGSHLLQDNTGFGQAIDSHTAHAATAFLLRECKLTEFETAEILASHSSWLLSLGSPRASCGPVLECLRLIDMTHDDVAEVIAAHPRVLLADADRDVLPLFEYLNTLGFEEPSIAELLKKAPWLVDEGARDRLAGSVAFWVGRGMSRPALRRLLREVPSAAAGGLQHLTQLKVEWLIENAGFTIEDFADVPMAIELPLGNVVAPRIAFAQHCGIPLTTVNREGQRYDQQQTLSIKALLSTSEGEFLAMIGASDPAYRAFEAAWRDSQLRTWLLDRCIGGNSGISQYEGLDWLAAEEMAELREVHDRYLARREDAWEQQQDRDREWQGQWKAWRKSQARRDQTRAIAKLLQQNQEKEVFRLATLERLGLTEERKGTTKITVVNNPPEISGSSKAAATAPEKLSCSKSDVCSRHRGHSGPCNKKRLHMDQISGDVPSQSIDGSKGQTSIRPGRGPALGGASINVKAAEGEAAPEVRALLLAHGLGPHVAPPSDIGADDGDLTTSIPEEELITKEVLESLPVDEVKRCARGLERLLAEAPAQALTPRVMDAWGQAQGYERACVVAAKGVLAASGIARVVAEPLWKYHGAAPQAWQLLSFLDETSKVRGATVGRSGVLTGGATAVVALSKKMLEEVLLTPEQAIVRKDLSNSLHQIYGRKNSVAKRITLAMSTLTEEGRLVRRRRKGLPYGPIEIVAVDLTKYLETDNYDGTSSTHREGA